MCWKWDRLRRDYLCVCFLCISDDENDRQTLLVVDRQWCFHRRCPTSQVGWENLCDRCPSCHPELYARAPHLNLISISQHQWTNLVFSGATWTLSWQLFRLRPSPVNWPFSFTIEKSFTPKILRHLYQPTHHMHELPPHSNLMGPWFSEHCLQRVKRIPSDDSQTNERSEKMIRTKR
jgi:hypothetical protein